MHISKGEGRLVLGMSIGTVSDPVDDLVIIQLVSDNYFPPGPWLPVNHCFFALTKLYC